MAAFFLFGIPALLFPQGQGASPCCRADGFRSRRAGAAPLAVTGASARTTVEGRGSARCKLPPGPLASYLMDSEASDASLLSAKRVNPSGDGAYECELAPIAFLALSVTPVMVLRIDRNVEDAVTVRTLEGRVRIGDKVQRSTDIGGLNTIRWTSCADGEPGWDLECDIDLTLSLAVPGLDNMPRLAKRAWLAAAKAIIRAAAGSGARKLLRSVEASYAVYGEPARR